MSSADTPKGFIKLSIKNIAYHKYIYISIAAIAVFYFINNLIWLKLNVYPHGPDEFSHLLIAQNFYNAIISGKIENLIAAFKLSTSAIWPPLFHFSAAGLCFISGSTAISPLLINLFCLLILLLSVYAIGYKLYNSNVGILATLLISFYPMVFRFSRFFGLDFAQLSIVSLSICLLVYTEYFTKRRLSLLFGISLGVGMLIKWTFILHLAGPLTCIILQAFLKREKEVTFYKVSVNLFLSFLIGILISSILYLFSYPSVSSRLAVFFQSFIQYHCGQSSMPKIATILEIDKFTGYLRFLINEQISLFFFIILLLAAPFFFKKCFHKLFLVSWYIIPYIALSLSFQKEGRFMLSSLPAIALISAAGLDVFFSYRPGYSLKHLFFALMLLFGLLQFFDVSYNYRRRDKTFPLKTPVGVVHLFCYSVTEQHGWALYGPPFKKDWKIDQIAVSIVKCHRNKLQPESAIIVGLIGEDDYVRQVFGFPMILDYYLSQENPGIYFRTIDFLARPREDDWSFIKKIDDLNYIVFISGSKNWPEFEDLRFVFKKFMAKVAALAKLPAYMHNIKQPYDFKDAPQRLLKFIDSKDEKFLLIDRIKLADGYFANIYTRK